VDAFESVTVTPGIAAPVESVSFEKLSRAMPKAHEQLQRKRGFSFSAPPRGHGFRLIELKPGSPP
jgi:hypothetical protein